MAVSHEREHNDVAVAGVCFRAHIFRPAGLCFGRKKNRDVKFIKEGHNIYICNRATGM